MSRSYGMAGCLAVTLLPAILLTDFVNGDLTWPRGIATTAVGALVLVVPLLRAGRGGAG